MSDCTIATTRSTDEALRIAREMLRVTRSGGHLMLADWRHSRKAGEDHRAMSDGRIAELFEINRSTEVVARERGALVPPLGRLLSRRAPSLYFAVQALLPFTVGQITTVLQKR